MLCLSFTIGCQSEVSKEYQGDQVSSWGYVKLGIEKLHENGYSCKGIKIAILDTGVTTNHPDLDIEKAVSVIDGEKTPEDLNSHGTMIAGVLAAEKNNIGVKGICPDATIFSVKVFNRSGTGTASNIIKGIEWAVQNQVDIINISLILKDSDKKLHEVIKRTTDSGIIIVAAAGNNFRNKNEGYIPVGYPAKYSEVISVGAVNKQGDIADFSPRNVDVFAPGTHIHTLYPREKYAVTRGTSIATPFVTGYIGLVLERHKEKDDKFDFDLNDIQDKFEKLKR